MYRKIKAIDDNGYYLIFQNKDIEFTNPIEFFFKNNISRGITIWSNLTKKEFEVQDIPEDIANKIIYENALNDWLIEYERINKTEIPHNFIALLSSSSKKEQIRLLKKQSLTPYVLLAFIFTAWEKFGFLFSEYKSEHYPKGTDKLDLPEFIHIDNDKVKIVGNSSLKEGELKQVIEHRKFINAKFIDKDKDWHCFFITSNSIGGKETWKYGQPHYHYISNQWGISRDEAVEKIISGNYPKTSVHIELLGFGNQSMVK